MSIIEEVEKLEDEIIELEHLLAIKKKELNKLLRGAYSPCLKGIGKHDRVYSNNFIEVMYKLGLNINSEFVKKSKDDSITYIEMVEFWGMFNFKEYTKKDWYKDLKKFDIMHYKNDKYYSTSIFYGNRKKCIMLKSDKLIELLGRVKTD